METQYLILFILIIIIYLIFFRLVYLSIKSKDNFLYDNLLYKHINNHCLNISKLNCGPIKGLFYIVYSFYFILNPLDNIFRYYVWEKKSYLTNYFILEKKKTKIIYFNQDEKIKIFSLKRKCLDTIIEFEVLFYLIAWITFFETACECEIINIFMLWRIASILCNKFQELTFIKAPGKNFESFNRTFIMTMINFLELIFIYSYLYSFGWFTINRFSGSFKSIRETLYIFVNWNVSDPDIILCPQQDLLILSQVFCFILIIMIFVSNISSIKYQDEK